jgi:hypothetical protein
MYQKVASQLLGARFGYYIWYRTQKPPATYLTIEGEECSPEVAQKALSASRSSPG